MQSIACRSEDGTDSGLTVGIVHIRRASTAVR